MPSKLTNLFGFTLLEILIALFVFTLLSLILAGALHNVIQSQEGAERTAAYLRKTQIVWLILSRDIEQTINRPILTKEGKTQIAFIGKANGFIFTHMGMANLREKTSTLQRTQYYWDKKSLWRITWPVLDQVPETQMMKRILLSNVDNASFYYIDTKGRMHMKWPIAATNDPLPSAVRISLSVAKGRMSQTYVISAQSSKNAAIESV